LFLLQVLKENKMETDYVGQLFNLANAFATPFAQKLAGDPSGTKTAEKTASANLRETIDNSRLNGSGPNDTSLATQQAPTSLFDFINGVTRTGDAKPQGNMMMAAIIVLGVAAIAFILFRRR
jgi:hypothetical protein